MRKQMLDELMRKMGDVAFRALAISRECPLVNDTFEMNGVARQEFEKRLAELMNAVAAAAGYGSAEAFLRRRQYPFERN